MSEDLPTIEEIQNNICDVILKSGKNPSDFDVSLYSAKGGKYDGRMLRKFGGFEDILNHLIENDERLNKSALIIRKYAELNKELGRRPTLADLSEAGYSRDAIKHYFSSLSRLEAESRNEYSDYFYDVDIRTLIEDSTTYTRLHKTVKKHKKFIITTAVTGCAVHEGFLDSLKAYCQLNNAALLILVVSDPAHNRDRGGYGTIDKLLSNECVVVEDTYLNSNFFISTIRLSAKQIHPTTGLSDIGQREGSFVFASPKQSMVVESTSNEKLPHVMMTTGAVTVPNYRTELYMSERTAYIADVHHVMGAVIVNVHDDSAYSYTQVQTMNEEGSFVHMGIRYMPDGETKVERPAALIMGDWHSGSTCPMVRKCTEEMMVELKPKRAYVHDGFDGASVNHHEEHNSIIRAQRFMGNAPSLEQEINGYAKDLNWMTNLVEELVIVKSNHDEFLSNHYLRFAKYAQDPQNHYYSLDLAKVMMEGNDPLKYAVEKAGLEHPERITWLQRDEDSIVGGHQCGAHGDIGPSGSRGSLRNMRRSYGFSFTGHTHTPGIIHGAKSVGTSSHLRLTYNRGPGSWLNTHGFLYEDGSYQLVNMIMNQWRV